MVSSAPELLELEITGIAHGGTFIARHEGRVVFVSDAIPGERVRARVTDDRKAAFWRAETVEVLEASPHRRAHIWPEADLSRDPEHRVGGADLGHIDLAHQRGLKQRVLGEALDRFAGGGLQVPEVAAVDDGDGTGWRTRLSLHVDAEGRIGPYAARSHTVIPVQSHPLARPRLAAEALSQRGARQGRIELVESADGQVHVLRRPEGAKRRTAGTIIERVGDRRFRLDEDGFWQVHPRAATVLDSAVREVLAGRIDPDATHYDLYGGVGLLASSLALAGARRIVTVESNARATAHARDNLADLDATAVTARVNRFVANQGTRGKTGAVVLDPPRSGAGRAVVEGLHAMAPDAIAYVACDPVALARDLGTFRDLGWQVETLAAFDLFPHSHHFEAVALLIR